MSDLSDREIFCERARAAGMRERLIDAWLEAANEVFGGGTPSEALAEGRLLEVVEATESFAAGREHDTPRCDCASHGLAAEYRHGNCAYGAAINLVGQDLRLSQMDGWADLPDSAVTVSVGDIEATEVDGAG